MTSDSQVNSANAYTTRRRESTRNIQTWFTAIVIFLAACACVPDSASDGGDGSTGTGEETGVEETGGPEGPIEPVGPIKCIEMIPNSVTCWVGWGLAWASVRLPCQAANNVSTGEWTSAYDEVLDPWGPVRCHDVVGAENSVCLYTDFGVLLTLRGEEWLPTVSALIGEYDEAAPPCDDQCADYPGSLGCECVPGECMTNLSCVQGYCTTCPPGSPGCPCDIDYCEVLACVDGMCPLG